MKNPYAAPQTRRLALQCRSRFWRKSCHVIALMLYAEIVLVLAYTQPMG